MNDHDQSEDYSPIASSLPSPPNVAAQLPSPSLDPDPIEEAISD